MNRRSLRPFTACLIAALILGFGATTLADTPKVKEIDFEDDHVLGELGAPEFMKTTTTEKEDLTTLVKARPDFVGEMRKSVEDL